MEVIKMVQELIEKPLKEENILIEEMIYEKEGSNYFLRVVINKMDLDECIKATRIIDPILEKNDIIKDPYILDVCSKGGN